MIIRKLGRDAFLYGGGDFLFKIIGFSVFPIYAHLFSLADFGVIALLGASAGLVGVVINFGVNNSIQRFYWDPGTTKEEQPILVTTGLLQLVSSGIVVLALLLTFLHTQNVFIHKKYGIEWDVLVLAVCAILPDQILQYVLDAIRLKFAPLKFLAISFCKNILGILFGLGMVIGLGWGLSGMFLGALLASSLTLPLGLWLIREDIVFKFDAEIRVRLLRYGYPFVFAGIAYWLSSAMDRWMLAQLSQPEDVGLYGIAFKFSAIVTFITAAFGQAWSPYAIRVFRDDPGYRHTYSKVLSLWLFLLAIVALGLSLFAGELLRLLTPEPYWVAAPTLVLTTIGAAIFGTTQVTALGISLEKKTGLLTYGALYSGIVNFLLNLVLIPKLGAVGAATATLISYLVLSLFFLYWTQRLHPIPLEKGKLLYGTFVLTLSLLSVALLPQDGVWGWGVIGKLAGIFAVLAGAVRAGIIDRTFLTSFFTSRA